MDSLIEIKSKIRMKKARYKDLLNDYELLKQNVKANIEEKKVMRNEINELKKE